MPGALCLQISVYATVLKTYDGRLDGSEVFSEIRLSSYLAETLNHSSNALLLFVHGRGIARGRPRQKHCITSRKRESGTLKVATMKGKRVYLTDGLCSCFAIQMVPSLDAPLGR